MTTAKKTELREALVNKYESYITDAFYHINETGSFSVYLTTDDKGEPIFIDSYTDDRDCEYITSSDAICYDGQASISSYYDLLVLALRMDGEDSNIYNIMNSVYVTSYGEEIINKLKEIDTTLTDDVIISKINDISDYDDTTIEDIYETFDNADWDVKSDYINALVDEDTIIEYMENDDNSADDWDINEVIYKSVDWLTTQFDEYVSRGEYDEYLDMKGIDDSETLATWSNGRYANDAYYEEETLCRKSDGEYFLYCEGGALSGYRAYTDNGHSTIYGEQYVWFDDEDEAKEWAKSKLDDDEYAEIFGEEVDTDEESD